MSAERNGIPFTIAKARAVLGDTSQHMVPYDRALMGYLLQLLDKHGITDPPDPAIADERERAALWLIHQARDPNRDLISPDYIEHLAQGIRNGAHVRWCKATSAYPIDPVPV